MRKFATKLTYTNIVGTLALFIALGGVSWAASLPKNSVGPDQLKKNAVTSKSIKDKSITGGDFKNATITGGKVNAATIGNVAKAEHAANADSVATELAPVSRRVGVSSNNADSTVALHAATEVPLLSNGTVSVVGKCYRSGTSVYASFLARSTVDGAVASFTAAFPMYGLPFFLNAGKSDETSYVLQGSVGANAASPVGGPPFVGVGTMLDPSGHGMDVQLDGFVKNGTLAAGDGVYGAGDVCIFNASGSKF